MRSDCVRDLKGHAKPAARDIRRGLVLIAVSLAWAASATVAHTAGYSDPKGAPSWLAAVHAQAVSAPNQGGAPQLTPPIIPQLETDPDPSGAISSYQPGGATTTATNAF